MRRPDFRRPRLAGLLWGTVAAVCVACGPGIERSGDAEMQLRWTFSPDPPRVGPAEVRVDVADVGWRPRNGAHVVLTGLRDGVALVVDTARGEGAGRYVAKDFVFEVAGAWILRTRVEMPDGRWTQEDLPLEVAAEKP